MANDHKHRDVANHEHRVLGNIVARHHTEVIAATHTLNDYDPPMQFLDPGAAGRDVVLPAESQSHGLSFWIFHNGAANNLTVKDDGGTTIIVIAPTDAGLVACDGTNWRGLVG